MDFLRRTMVEWRLRARVGNRYRTGFVVVPLLFYLFVHAQSISAEKPDDGLRRLLKAYPDHLDRAEGNCLIWKDGTRMPYNDGRAKSFQALLDSADLEDQMRMRL